MSYSPANQMFQFDHNKKGILTPDEFFNVVKLQNGVECTKEEVVFTTTIINRPGVAGAVL